MKHLLVFFIIPFLLFNSTDQKQDFVGKWIGEDKGEIGYIIFDDEGYATFEIGGQTMGGKEFFINGTQGKMTYNINYETNPVEVDFTITKILSGESKTVLSIAEFIDEDTMTFNMSFNDIRPTDFGESSITLKRVK